MFSTRTSTNAQRRHINERGAALISVLLISTLLLTAGGALILTTAMTGTGTVDATAEMEAYYTAEAGLQRALNVLRSNDLPAGSLPNGVNKLTFRLAIPTPTTVSTLATWLAYDGPTMDGAPTMRIGSNLYSIAVSDPDNTPPTSKPTRLLVRATGYGPRRAVKKLEAMIMQSDVANFSASGAVTLRGADIPPEAPPALVLDTGNSNVVRYSGIDASAPNSPGVPAFTVTSYAVATATSGIQRPNQVNVRPGTPSVGVLGADPEWLQDVEKARAFVDLLRDIAMTGDPGTPDYRYFPTQPSTSNIRDFTFVDGNVDFGPGNNGSGLLVVTGDLSMRGNSSFNGLIYVLGGGRVTRSGGGNGTITGGIVIARFGPTDDHFLAPVFSTNGGGNSLIQFSSAAVSSAVQSVPSITAIGVVEK